MISKWMNTLSKFIFFITHRVKFNKSYLWDV